MPEEREIANRRRRADILEFDANLRELARNETSGIGTLGELLPQDQVVIMNPVEGDLEDMSTEDKILHIVGSSSLGCIILPKKGEERNQLIAE